MAKRCFKFGQDALVGKNDLKRFCKNLQTFAKLILFFLLNFNPAKFFFAIQGFHQFVPNISDIGASSTQYYAMSITSQQSLHESTYTESFLRVFGKTRYTLCNTKGFKCRLLFFGFHVIIKRLFLGVEEKFPMNVGSLPWAPSASC